MPLISVGDPAHSRINATAPIIETVRGHVDLSLVLDVNAYSAARNDPSSSSALPRLANLNITESSSSTKDDHSSNSHTHALNQISTLAIPLPSRLSKRQVEALDLAIRALLWEGRLPSSSLCERPTEATEEGSLEILRTKGYFNSREGEEGGGEGKREHVIQGVREIYEIREVGVGRINDEDTGGAKQEAGKLVLIGKGLKGWMVDVIARYVRDE